MNDLYLIAHKVRGEPAFDIAIHCDDMGTEDDPGPWWIIPTSGHRAYPFWHSNLFSLINEGTGCDAREGWLGYIMTNMPPDHPDHYQLTAAPRKAPGDLLKKLGLGQPDLTNFKRRI